MAETRGVWSLSEAWGEKAAAEWVPVPNIWLSADNNIGYWVGGGPSPSSKSVVDKMNYSSNTTARVPGADIGVPKNDTTCAGTSTKGFAFYGFNGSSYFSSIEKIEYATDTRTTPGSLPNPERSSACAIGSPTKAYITGGYYPGGPIDGTSTYEYATGSAGTMPGIGNYFSMAGSGNTTHGYVGGGPNPNSFMFKFTYASNSEAQLPGSPLSTPGGRKKPLSAASSTGSYFTGGNPGQMTTTDKLTFATDGCARIPGANALSGVAYMQGTGNSNSAYMLNWNAVTFQNLSYSTDTYSNLPSGANLSVNRGTSFGCVSGQGNNQPEADVSNTRWFDNTAASPNFGYSVTGRKSSNWAPGPAMEFTYKVDYGTDTSSNSPSAGASYGLEQAFGAGNSTTGYKMGGRSNDEPADGSERGEKFVYATDTRASAPNYGNRRYGSFMVTNGTTNLIGTAGRGQPSNNLRSNTYKMTYASESWSTVPSQNTSSTRKAGAALATSTNGYFAGGGNGQPSVYSNVDKYSFSNDTQARVPAANLTNSMDGNRGFSRGDAGYSMGGLTGGGDYIDTIDKITFSTDTTAVFPSSLPQGVQANQTMSSNSTGYAVGGQGPSPSGWDHSAVSKMSFATGTFSASGNLPTYQHHGIGMSAGSDNLPFAAPPASTPGTPETTIVIPATLSDNGYYMGGDVTSSGLNSQVLKLTYASETSSTLSAKIPANVEEGQACNSATAGYAVGGSTPSRSNVTARITMSNDAIATVPGATTPNPVNNGEGVGTVTNGYIFCGATPSATGGGSQIFKMTYSNETFANSPAKWTGPGSSNIRLSAYCNSTNGYMVGGELPSNYNGYVRYVFSTDTASTIPATLSLARKESGGVGYEDVAGYVTGGNPSTSRTDKLTYSTETSARVPSADATWDDIYQGVINGNRTAGYWSCSTTVAVEKLTYSSESYATVPGAQLPGNNRKAAAGFSAKGNNGGKVATPNVI